MFWLLPIVAASALLAPLAEQPADPFGKRKELVKVTVVPRDTMVKPGETVQVGVVLDVAKDWHVYWPGQSDTGTPTTVELTFPSDSGFTAGAVTFPVPKRHALPGDILDYILEGKVIVTVPVKVPTSATIGRKVHITAKVNYLVCNESCQPGDATVDAAVVIADKTDGKESSAKLIDDARAAQPKPQAEGFDAAASAKWDGQTLVLVAKEAAVTQFTFYPSDGAAKLLTPIKSGQAKGKSLRLEFEPGLKPVDGVVELTSGNTAKAWTFHMARPQPPAVTPAPPAAPPAPATPAASPIVR